MTESLVVLNLATKTNHIRQTSEKLLNELEENVRQHSQFRFHEAIEFEIVDDGRVDEVGVEYLIDNQLPYRHAISSYLQCFEIVGDRVAHQDGISR